MRGQVKELLEIKTKYFSVYLRENHVRSPGEIIKILNYQEPEKGEIIEILHYLSTIKKLIFTEKDRLKKVTFNQTQPGDLP